MGVRPPGVLLSWDDLVTKNDLDTMSSILAYNQIREHEEWEAKEAELKVICGTPRL